ncbi:MAG: RnfABCDGE type electron transport complex subunit D [Oscillospiraceae bacterium]|nr:RnfABCDGE type electron transport complex subunit D [Oscillospiraceae bacterium]
MDKYILDKFDYAPEIPAKSENKAKKANKSSRIYLEQLLCLLLLAVVSYMGSGLRVVVIAGFSVAGAVVMDMIGCALSKKVYNPLDLSTIMAGLCLALLMPAGAAYPMAFFGSAMTIAIKHIFGGKNNYIFNPTAVVFSFMILCYPGAMLLFPKPHAHLPVWGDISPTLLSGLTPIESVSTFNILMGNFTGAMGAVHILVILVSGISLLLRRSVSASFTITALSVNVLFSNIFSVFTDNPPEIIRGTLVVMVSGCFLFILVFLANDPQTLPKTFLGKIYYGVMFGGMTVLFRVFGKVEGYPAFALLLVNTMSERSDILARQTISAVKRTTVFVQARLGSYERIREKAETVDEAVLRPALSDTQEIILNLQDYNMPPIDNKIIKINRKKPGLIVRIKEKVGSLAEKVKNSHLKKPETEAADVNFLENLFDGVRELGNSFKKKETVFETAEEEFPEEKLTPLKLSLLIDDNDVVEIDVDEPKPPEKTPQPQQHRKKKASRL